MKYNQCHKTEDIRRELLKAVNKKVHNKLIKNKEHLDLISNSITEPSLVNLEYSDLALLKSAKDVSFEKVNYRNYKKLKLEAVKNFILIFFINKKTTFDEIDNVSDYLFEKVPYAEPVSAVRTIKGPKERKHISVIKIY